MDNRETKRTSKPISWSSVAFIVESMLLLVFLVASLAVLTRVFTSSLNESVESRSLDAAVIAASSIAEHFAADPNDIQETTQLGDLMVTCDVSKFVRNDGMMHTAVITVYSVTDMSEPVYTLTTSHYEKEVA